MTSNDKCDLCGLGRQSHLGCDAKCTGYFLDKDDGLVDEIQKYLEDDGLLFLSNSLKRRKLYEEIITLIRQHDNQWISDLESCLGEAVDLMEDIVKGEYTPDSFTTQTWRKALNNIPSPPDSEK